MTNVLHVVENTTIGCGTCVFYVADKGECRRFPPKVVYDTSAKNEYVSLWPNVDVEDSCGEWASILNPEQEYEI